MADVSLWILLQLLPELASTAIIFHFMMQLAGKRHSAGKYWLALAFATAWATFLSFLPLPGFAARLAYVLFFFLLALYWIKTTRSVALSAAWMAVTSVCLSNNITFAILSIVLPSLSPSTLAIASYVATIAMILLNAFILQLSTKLFPTHSELPNPHLLWVPLATIFVFTLLLESFYLSNTAYIDTAGQFSTGAQVAVNGFEVLGTFAFATAGYFVSLLSYFRFVEYRSKEHQRIQLAQQLELQKAALVGMQQSYDTANAIKHDLANHYGILSKLIQNGNLPDALQYLDQLGASFNQEHLTVQTGDTPIDVLLSEKGRQAQQQNTQFVCDVHAIGAGTMTYDVCILLSNALDNALRAAPHGKIELCMSRKKDFIVITMSNTKSANPKPGSGIGLKNIEAVVRKYHGDFEIAQSADHFEISVLLHV